MDNGSKTQRKRQLRMAGEIALTVTLIVFLIAVWRFISQARPFILCPNYRACGVALSKFNCDSMACTRYSAPFGLRCA